MMLINIKNVSIVVVVVKKEKAIEGNCIGNIQCEVGIKSLHSSELLVELVR